MLTVLLLTIPSTHPTTHPPPPPPPKFILQILAYNIGGAINHPNIVFPPENHLDTRRPSSDTSSTRHIDFEEENIVCAFNNTTSSWKISSKHHFPYLIYIKTRIMHKNALIKGREKERVKEMRGRSREGRGGWVDGAGQRSKLLSGGEKRGNMRATGGRNHTQYIY